MLAVQQSHSNMSKSTTGGTVPIQDLCALAYTLPGLGQALRSQASVLPLAHAIAEHAALRIQRADTPPIVRSWCDLLYGLTKAGLVANIDSNASQEAVKQDSPHLQHLLDVAAQQLPALLRNQGAVEQDISLTLLAYAYAGYTGDLGPVTQALVSNLDGCLRGAMPQNAGNILWALGKLCDMGQQEHQQSVNATPTMLFSYCLGALQRQLAEVKPQEVSNAVYGCALAGHVEGVPQLLDLACQQPQVMAAATSQSWSNTIWAAAKLGCVEQGSVLLKRLVQQAQVMTAAISQNWSNTLWASATMYEAAAGQDLQGNLARELQHSGQLLMTALLKHCQTLVNADTQFWSNTLWAAAKLGCVEQGSVLLRRLTDQPHLMTAAESQTWSNTLWASATMYEAAAGQDLQGNLARELQHSGQLLMTALLKHCQTLDDTYPQEWSNIIWAAAKLGCVEQGSVLLQRLASQPQVLTAASPQNWSNTLWAAAKLGCVEQGSVLLDRLASQPQVMQHASPQHWSNSIWAAASMYQAVDDTTSASKAVKRKVQKGGRWLLQACASSPTALQGASSQNWSNTLWAAAVLRWYDQSLFNQGAVSLAAMPPGDMKPQEISNALYACALCAHWDNNVQQLLGRVEVYDLAAFTAQSLANSLYAVAVLSCVTTTSEASRQQHQGAWISAAQALFKEAAGRNVSTFVQENLRQLNSAHIYAGNLGIPGLPVGPVLKAARAAGWSSGKPTISDSQREVASVLQQLGYTTQLEMRSPDGLISADVGVTALPDGRPCSIAVEFDGPSHFVTDNSSGNSTSSNNRTAATDRLNGPTRLRNAFLQAHFPDGVVCIPWMEWPAASKPDQQEEYLRAALAQAAGQQVSFVCWEGCIKMDSPLARQQNEPLHWRCACAY
jgi:hypothetical protein